MKKAFATQMPLRLPTSLHEKLKIAAQREGVSLNQYCLYILARQLESDKDFMRRKAEKVFRFLEEAQVFQKELQKNFHRHEINPQETPLERQKKIHAAY